MCHLEISLLCKYKFSPSCLTSIFKMQLKLNKIKWVWKKVDSPFDMPKADFNNCMKRQPWQWITCAVLCMNPRFDKYILHLTNRADKHITNKSKTLANEAGRCGSWQLKVTRFSFPLRWRKAWRWGVVLVLVAEASLPAIQNKMPRKLSRYLWARVVARPYASTLIMRDLGREGLWVELWITATLPASKAPLCWF